MRVEDWWHHWHLEDLLESYLPDFILAFAFFTSVVYAVLGKRFEQQRPAIAMSAAIGFALSIGLVWWEQANDFSIKNLGPIAVGFALLLLGLCHVPVHPPDRRLLGRGGNHYQLGHHHCIYPRILTTDRHGNPPDHYRRCPALWANGVCFTPASSATTHSFYQTGTARH